MTGRAHQLTEPPGTDPEISTRVTITDHNSSEQLARLTVVELNRGINYRQRLKQALKRLKYNALGGFVELNRRRNIVGRNYECLYPLEAYFL